MSAERRKVDPGDVRALVDDGTVAGFDEGQLLERFAARGDESAFAALLALHGPMVLAVCRRTLTNPSDVEDAFQATFLALARKARAIRSGQALGGWLHRVACRVAIELNRDAARRRTREAVAAATATDGERGGARLSDDFWPTFHEELGGLPERLRRPVIACYLEGRTQEEAAAELRWSGATLRRRLAEARERLRSRLERRGVAPSSAFFAAAFRDHAAPAVPRELATATTRSVSAYLLGTNAAASAALRLSGRVLRDLLMTQFQTAAKLIPVAVAATCLAVGVVAARHGGADRRAQAGVAPDPAAPDARPSGIKVATVQARAMTLTQPYVCRLHAIRHGTVRPSLSGTLRKVPVKAGQRVKQGDRMFLFDSPALEMASRVADAEAQLAQLEYNYTKKLADKKVVSEDEVRILELKLTKARAREQMARRELDLCTVVAPFDGVIGRITHEPGAFVQVGEDLADVWDDRTMQAVFDAPESTFRDLRARPEGSTTLALQLSDGQRYALPGKLGAIEGNFNPDTATIPLHADFPNPEGFLREGQGGTLLLSREEAGAIVVPKGATFEVQGKRFLYVVALDGVAHRREIAVRNELDDFFVVQGGVLAGDRIVVEGVESIREGSKVQ